MRNFNSTWLKLVCKYEGQIIPTHNCGHLRADNMALLTHLGELEWESDLSQSVFQLWNGYPSTFLMDWNVRRVNARCSGVPLMENIPMALFHITYRIQNLFHRHKSYTLLFFFFFWLGNVLYRGICRIYLGL